MALKGEYSSASPALRSAVDEIGLPQGMEVTSVISGPHKGRGHPEGRAVDIGLPRTAQAWGVLVRAIKSGRFAKIGTVLDVVNNPQMQALARQYGVELFQDDQSTGATGDHAHLEIAP